MPPDFRGAPCRAHVALFTALIDLAYERPSVPPDAAARARIDTALAVCRGCPVIAECAEVGAKSRGRGVWGGLWWDARSRSRRKVSLCADCGAPTSRADYVRCAACYWPGRAAS